MDYILTTRTLPLRNMYFQFLGIYSLKCVPPNTKFKQNRLNFMKHSSPWYIAYCIDIAPINTWSLSFICRIVIICISNLRHRAYGKDCEIKFKRNYSSNKKIVQVVKILRKDSLRYSSKNLSTKGQKFVGSR